MSHHASAHSRGTDARRPCSRRKHPGLAVLCLVAAATFGGCAANSEHGGADAGEHAASSLIQPGMTVLFQGDSITDAGRARDEKIESRANHHRALGHGYASLAAAGLMMQTAPEEIAVYNRGISGHKVFQLADRWDRDCLELKPDIVSILIGVNDIWHKRNGNYDGTIEVYERDYDALLARTREALPNATLVVCEPFVLTCGAVDETWFPEFDGYRQASRRVADKHGAIFVPFHSMFQDALEQAPAEHWARDGVHPSRDGAALMAKTWLEIVSAHE
ncbi:MAG: SGNH/GDSL hydrolase family protein [Planctomycetota bacterium]